MGIFVDVVNTNERLGFELGYAATDRYQLGHYYNLTSDIDTRSEHFPSGLKVIKNIYAQDFPK